MTLKELKAKIKPGTMLRKVRGWPRPGRQDTMRVVASVNSVGFAMDGEGIPPDKGPSRLQWPKAKELTGTDRGFFITDGDDKAVFEYEWVTLDNATIKDGVVSFILNSLEHCENGDEEVLDLGDIVGDHGIAVAILAAWHDLAKTDSVKWRALQRPEPCDRSLREWLDGFADWSNIVRTIDRDDTPPQSDRPDLKLVV